MPMHLDPDKCLACTTCVVHCPVAAATPAFSGPRMIGPAFERFRLLGLTEDTSLTYCANCKNCEIACPQNVPVATINMLARLAQCKDTPPSFRDWIVAHGETIARTLRFVPASLKNMGMRMSIVRLLLDAIGIAKECPMPAFAKKSLRDLFAHSNTTQQAKTVALFPGCYTNYYDPQTGLDLIFLLQKAGYHVLVPREFVCCGIPLISGGFEADAEKNAQTNARVLADFAKKNIPVLTLCPSCRLMLTREVKEFFPSIIDTFGIPNILDASVFLKGCIQSGELIIPQGVGPTINALYHAPCHLRAQGEGLPGFELLSTLPSLAISNVNAGCCGISGSYGFKKEKYAIGQKIGSQLFETIKASGLSLVISECGTCRLQIEGATKSTCLHPVSVLRSSLSMQ
ncbi:MAG: anaerobic glycerol-3-phosphate dehydrogenase subunit C [Desulfovibrio sp.]|nr:anaerobic glycerol-3-phosphate dehydrogenase subunit C [Desulfovibrio sp.]